MAQALIAPILKSPGYWAGVWQRFLKDKVALCAALVVLLLIILALFGSWLTPADPFQASIMKRLKPIGTEGFPLGADELGRDMLSRLMVGAQLSLFMGITPVLLAFAIGSSLGVLAGYVGGWPNIIIMRTIDVFYAFPSVLLAIAFLVLSLRNKVRFWRTAKPAETTVLTGARLKFICGDLSTVAKRGSLRSISLINPSASKATQQSPLEVNVNRP